MIICRICPVLFSIFASDCKSPCPMDSTRVPRELRVLKNMHNRVTVCVLCLFVVMASFVAIKWIGAADPLEMTPPTVCSLTCANLCTYITMASPYNPLIEMKKLLFLESNQFRTAMSSCKPSVNQHIIIRVFANPLR